MKSSPEPVLVIHHAIPQPGSCPHAESDAGVMDEVKAVADSLKALGAPCRIEAIDSLAALTGVLNGSPERVVFNLVEHLPPRPGDAALVPAICAAFGKTCTGNDTACQSLAQDKWRTKGVLQAAGIPVPTGVLVAPGQRPSRQPLPRGTVIVKPLFADASEGIHADSVVPSPGAAVEKAIRRVHVRFRQPALVEQFFGSRELNVSVMERHGGPEVLPLAEIEFRGYGRNRPRIVDYAAKWHAGSFEYRNTVRVIPAPLAAPLTAAIRQCALTAWQALGCSDYARVDLRLDDDGQFAVLEVNPNPDISPESGFAAALKAARIPFSEFVGTLCRNALRRQAKDLPPARKPRRAIGKPSLKPGVTIRYSIPADRDPVITFLKATKFFRDNEIDIAAEVLDDALKQGPDGHYQSFTLTVRGKPAGWVCFGPTPCTIGTYDVYWLGVSPHHQGQGYGRALLEHAERLIRRRKGRLIVIETSGQSLYGSTRGFYLSLGYRDTARVADFYAPRDPRVIYTKALPFLA